MSKIAIILDEDFVDKEVVEDRKIISSRCPDDIPAFNNRIIKKLQECR